MEKKLLLDKSDKEVEKVSLDCDAFFLGAGFCRYILATCMMFREISLSICLASIDHFGKTLDPFTQVTVALQIFRSIVNDCLHATADAIFKDAAHIWKNE